ncbi:extracellular solute-binding protein [Cohnella candidum]|uniref:Extracellular solute-binding protein n=1 Tax=Cohnella candidum TaxID=2674991 RepID=A0A3G3K3X4_9BACL|nr:extracellular solute-binding protein [Cohnella candidum]AYQ75216.1 extracellular solute-binding protein [Cohnella candidum]
MHKKVSTLLALVVATALTLSACSGGKNEENSASPSTGASSAGSSASASPSGDGGAASFPLKQKITLKAVSPRPALAPSDFNELEIAKKIEAATNVHIEWETIVDTDYQEKKNLLIASGSLPDFFYGAGFSDAELMKYGKDGTIIPLNDLIDKHMPNLKALFDKRPDLKALVTAPDGNIYSLPSGEELGTGQETIGSNPDFLYINQDWLDKLKLSMPTTIEEYHNVLKAFKTQDPNGNGKADEIPLTFMNAFWTGDIGYLFGAFGMPDKTYQPGNNAYAEHLNVDNGKVSYAAVQPQFKQALAYFHQWFEEGLVDKESLTQDVTQYFAKGKSDPETLGSFLWWDHTDVVADRDKHYPIVPPFKDMVVKFNNGGSGVGRGGSVITKDDKNPELTAQWLDYLYEPHTAAEVRWGPVGVWFDQDASGKLVQKSDLQNPGEFRQKVQLGPSAAGVITGEDFQKVVAPEARAQQRMDDIKNIFVPQMQKEKFPDIFFTEDELKKIEQLKPDIQTFTDSQRAKFLLNGVTDGEWDQYVDKLKKMGLDDLLKIYQDGYDRYMAAQK